MSADLSVKVYTWNYRPDFDPPDPWPAVVTRSGIWSGARFRVAARAMAASSRGALWGRQPGWDLLPPEDSQVLERGRLEHGWFVPLETRRGELRGMIVIRLVVPSLHDATEVGVTGYPWDAAAYEERERIHAMTHGAARQLAASATADIRQLILGMADDAERERLRSTRGQSLGPSLGPEAKTAGVARRASTQPGRSLDLFGAEDRT